jgi:hypothetical protein
MRSLFLLGLAAALLASPPAVLAQDAPASLATLHLADGTTVALLEWKLSYDFATWRKKDRISNAKPETRESEILLLGKKSYSLKGDTLSLTHQEDGDSFRVVSMNLKKGGEVKMEQPDKDVIAPRLEKDYLYQPRSLDISGKTFSGIDRSFCIVSFSALVDCGGTNTTRVVRIDFN